MSEVIFTDDNFSHEVKQENNKPVLVDFWAAWCGPCRVQGPIVEEVAKEIGVVAKVGKLEVDENPKTAEEFAVMSIPTLMIFKDGKVVWQGLGITAKEKLLAELKKAAN